MNKDALLATLIGFFIGVVITGGILFGPKALKLIPKNLIPKFSFSLPSQSKKITTNPKPTSTQSQSPNDLIITSPLPDSISNSDTLLVSGTAPVDSYIVVGGMSDEDAMVVKKDGTFAGKILMNEGKNDITVTAWKDNKLVSKSVTVYYTQEKL